MCGAARALSPRARVDRSERLLYDARVRIALVSPYSYTYPGGVGRHVEALAQQFLHAGHDVRVLAPFDPDDRVTRATHRGARPQLRELPDHVIPLGRTIGFSMNGSRSNVSLSPDGLRVLDRELRHGGYAVVHVHEPNAGAAPVFATESARVPLVGTFHTYSTGVANRIASGPVGLRRLYNKLNSRIAVSEAAR